MSQFGVVLVAVSQRVLTGHVAASTGSGSCNV